MIFRVVITIIILALVYYLYRIMTGNSEYRKCQKCNGQGYWKATRGERDKCDICKGSGKVLR
jgi:DnaJ-class molecular chaperone